MNLAHIVEYPPKDKGSHGFSYALQTLDGQTLRHGFARGAVRTGGKRTVDPDKREEVIGQLQTWAQGMGWEIVEGPPDSSGGQS